MSSRSVRMFGVGLLTSAAAFAAIPAVNAACSDRPGTPINVTARVTSEHPPTIQVSWTNTATETVFWDVEMTDEHGTVLKGISPGVGRGDDGKGLRISNSYSVPAGEKRCFRVRARTARGTEGCVSLQWSGPPACAMVSNPATARCREYALQAREARTEALGRYGCDRRVISGKGWEASYTEHFTWCLGARPAAVAAETAKRTRIMHQCRVDAAKPKGTARITVIVNTAVKSFFIRGTGFAPNARVILRFSGAGVIQSSITDTIADAKGEFSKRVFAPPVCRPRMGYTIAITAEDQDKPASPPVDVRCPR